jgi:hypothetical protein
MRRAGQNPTDIEEEKDFSFLSLFFIIIYKSMIGSCRPSGKFHLIAVYCIG